VAAGLVFAATAIGEKHYSQLEKARALLLERETTIPPE
jgi:hypothetical protein